jgi:hypothetical protein
MARPEAHSGKRGGPPTLFNFPPGETCGHAVVTVAHPGSSRLMCKFHLQRAPLTKIAGLDRFSFVAARF